MAPDDERQPDRTTYSRALGRRLRRVVRVRTRAPVGAAPGTIRIHPDAPAPVLRVTCYGAESIEEHEIDSVDAIPSLLEKWNTVWINVDGLGDETILRAFADLFNIHRLALEDVVNTYQRPKLEPYEGLLFLVLRMIRSSEVLENEQVSLFLKGNAVLTFQERRGDCFDPVRERLRHGKGRIRGANSDYLAYALIDAIIDAYFPTLERFGDRLEAIENEILVNPETSLVARIHEVKRDLLMVRRGIWPLREALNTLMRNESGMITPETRVYLRDCYDHVVQAIDLVETYRELASSQMDLYLSAIGQRTNDIMKVLTIFAAIFIPLSFIAGLYGMNFDTSSPFNMPELNWRYGYFFALCVMLGVALGLLTYFWWNGWIGGGGRHRRPANQRNESDGKKDEHGSVRS